ncbi:AraC family transcriptional regulator [Herbaspirillum chlorophenolicum]|uniref:AraC family transcriptional regulator n=1 Tax=Herbaspirillum chlorophenolicum TaxID=211589 RepID=UPI0009E3E93B|nr:helix-turn-helix domain-containing protein [Herbaspirillum chlorophenolicum]
MSKTEKSVDDHENVLIEAEKKLLHRSPFAGSRIPQKPRRSLPCVLDDWRIARAVHFMERNIAEPLSLEVVAAHVKLSPYHFQRYFKETMGETPSAYLRRIRLDQAALRLLLSDRQVADIAFGASYASHEAFVRAFHQQFGWVPSQYRTHARGVSSVPQPEELRRTDMVQVKRLQDMPLLALRFYGPYANVEANWKKFATVADQARLPLDRLQVIGIVYDNPEITPNELIRYDCALVDTGFDVGSSALTPVAFAADTYATLEHQAPYQEIFSTYRVLSFAWLSRVAGEFALEETKAYEFYLDPPWENFGATQRFNLTLPVRKIS